MSDSIDRFEREYCSLCDKKCKPNSVDGLLCMLTLLNEINEAKKHEVTTA